MGDIHTNTIEGFWSLVKRGIGGVYHSVSQKYLQTYLDEYSFRYNRRASGNLIFPAIQSFRTRRHVQMKLIHLHRVPLPWDSVSSRLHVNAGQPADGPAGSMIARNPLGEY